MDDGITFGELVRRYRGKLSLRDAEALTGVPHSTIRRIEEGSTSYRGWWHTINALSSGLEIPWEEMDAALSAMQEEKGDGQAA